MIHQQIKEKDINGREYITLQKLLDLVGSSSFYYLLFVITFITSIPSPSWGFGSSTIPGGILVLIISIQILLDFDHVYLPKYFKTFKIKTKYLKKIKKYINGVKNTSQDAVFFEQKLIHRISALMMIPCSILMMFPLVLTNWAPSFGVTMLSLSHILKNTFWLKVSYVFIVFITIFYVFAIKYFLKFVKKIYDKYKHKINSNKIKNGLFNK